MKFLNLHSTGHCGERGQQHFELDNGDCECATAKTLRARAARPRPPYDKIPQLHTPLNVRGLRVCACRAYMHNARRLSRTGVVVHKFLSPTTKHKEPTNDLELTAGAAQAATSKGIYFDVVVVSFWNSIVIARSPSHT